MRIRNCGPFEKSYGRSKNNYFVRCVVRRVIEIQVKKVILNLKVILNATFRTGPSKLRYSERSRLRITFSTLVLSKHFFRSSNEIAAIVRKVLLLLIIITPCKTGLKACYTRGYYRFSYFSAAREML